jgi:hypothetical protein
MECENCGHDHHPLMGCNEKHLTPRTEPARPSEGSVTCSDLICELEAALRRIEEIGDGCMCDRPGGCGCGASAASIARETLRPKRRRSQIESQAHPLAGQKSKIERTTTDEK